MIELFFCVLLTIGCLTLFSNEIRAYFRSALSLIKIRLAPYRDDAGDGSVARDHFKEKFPEHIRLLLQTAFSMGTKKSVRAFLILSAAAGAAVMLLIAGRISWLLTVGAACMGCMLPYLFLRCFVQGKQVSGSREGEVLVTELLNNYKIHYYNMVHAVEQTAMSLEEAPYSRRLLLNLSRGLNKASGDREMQDLLKEFQFSLGTSWAGILTMDIYLSCSSGIRVSESMSDLALSLKRAREVEEYLHRENNEVRLILKYLMPASFVLLTVGGIHFFDLSFGEWIKYQFGTSAGIAWMLVTVILYMAAVGIYLLLSVRKFDL